MHNVTIITATTGNPLLAKCINSVRQQTNSNIQHIIVVDGQERWDTVNPILESLEFPQGNERVCVLPYPTGTNRYNGHRIYGAFTYLADGDFIIYLDEDNSLQPTHVDDCLKVMSAGNQWAFSFRGIFDKESNFICNDNCESLGKWASVMHPDDYFVDVNCFFLPKQLALHVSPIWHRKAREPGVPEVDRALTHVLRQIAPKYDTTYNYTVNYTVGNTGLSVQDSFFIKGNAEMERRYGGKLPWQK